ncbi:MAG: hypothetical protein GXP55_12540 [Deltaproteobacteria bacterium]|nr:hypothetical protein [Deltaproteobacteria bacterium]
MLQELLNLGLVHIGSDDSRFEKMQAAANALRKRFEESPELMITATLIALDEDVDEDEPFFELVEGLVINEWKTLRNTHVNRPRELLRSIAISALTAAADEDPERSAIVWNTAASRLIHDQTSLGKASGLLSQRFQEAFSSAESEALRRAGMRAVTTKKKHRKSKPSSAQEGLSISGAINDGDILQDVARAAGPQYPQGQPLDDPNPQWGSNPSQPQWSVAFTPRMAEALVKAVNLGTSRLADSIGSELAIHMAAIEARVHRQLVHIESLQSKLSESEAAGHMRLDVLWWSQARYSPSQKTAYSTLPTATAALAAVADLTVMVPALAPASITHVLGETIAACTRSERMSLTQHLKNLSEARPLGLEGVLRTAHSNEVRVPLLEVVAEVAKGSTSSNDDLRSRTGVDPELMLNPAELAMWLFRELQARRIAEGVT